MKRSKIVSLIKCYQDERFGNGQLAHLSDLEYSDFLLLKLEEQGMRPPVGGSLKSMLAAVHNEWEPEDET